jgi:hypothetical protein
MVREFFRGIDLVEEVAGNFRHLIFVGQRGDFVIRGIEFEEPFRVAATPTPIQLGLFVGSILSGGILQKIAQILQAAGDAVEIGRVIHEPIGFGKDLAGALGILAGFLKGQDLFLQLAKLDFIGDCRELPSMPDEHDSQRDEDEDDEDPKPSLHGRRDSHLHAGDFTRGAEGRKVSEGGCPLSAYICWPNRLDLPARFWFSGPRRNAIEAGCESEAF